MLILQGQGVSPGVMIGRAVVWRSAGEVVARTLTDDPEEEVRRFTIAQREAVEELERLHAWAKKEIGERDAEIFAVHAMMAEDEDFIGAILSQIREGRVVAEFAVAQVEKEFMRAFTGMEDSYMRERAGDVRDIAERLCRHLHPGEEPAEREPTEDEGQILPRIICADDLTPSQTVQLDKKKVGAFITARGAANSHTAILSRTMGLPAVVGIGTGWQQIPEGALLGIDADEGTVYVDPDQEVLKNLRERMEAEKKRKVLLEEFRGRESRTRDGYAVEICANISGTEDMGAALENDAEGVGLFRSEFLYLGREIPPGEEEQYRAYRQVLEKMAGKRVVVRTLDIGADKRVNYLGLPPEENPALGCRAIRISLTKPELFLTQARALLRASVYGRLAVMFPMVTSEWEVMRLRELWGQAREELREQGVRVADTVELGIMIETPAAALISDRLAGMVDFFSIGTNDLIQYTLAVDRQNTMLGRFCDPHHPAVLDLIRRTAENARRAGIWVGICGELGADLSLTESFLRMGIRELSVTPPAILPLREKVCRLCLSEKKDGENGADNTVIR